MRREGYRWLGAAQSRRGRFTSQYRPNCRLPVSIKVAVIAVNTFTAIVDLSRFNNSCLKWPTSTLVDLTFQSRALRSFSLNQLVTCHYRRETYTAASVYLADIIFILFIVQYTYIAI